MKHGPELGDTSASGGGVARLAASIEAALITSPRAVSAERIAAALGLTQPAQHPAPDAPAQAAPEPPRPTRRKPHGHDDPAALVQRAVDWLNRQYADTGRAFRIEALAGGYRLVTLAEHRGVIEAMQGLRAGRGLSKPAIEALAIIAYRQPISRAGVEAIRGVACGEVIKSLTERRLVTVVGRAEEIGRPLLYGTTKAFLEVFGLASIKELPTEKELGALGHFGPADEPAHLAAAAPAEPPSVTVIAPAAREQA
ncbi:MAG: SMC-Scp complex subunit ScpB [Planctomyces sp.]|nr:SMC-Scp complex subunit ScpB [Planctomyces sp.]MBA4119288.1 SMC-Scp complex subunit ScpB [Isosphaera sp.]